MSIMKIRFSYLPVVLFGLLFCLLSNTLVAQNKTELQKKRNKILQEIKYTNKLIAKNQENSSLTSNEIKTLDAQIKLRQDLVNNINYEVKGIKNKIKDNEEVIASLEVDLSNMKEEYAQLIYLSYKNRNSQDRMMYIFASDDFFQAVRRMQFLKDMSSHRKEQGLAIESAKNSIDKKTKDLMNQRAEKEVLLRDAIEAKKSIDKDKRKKEEALAILNQDEEKLKDQLNKQKKERQKLQKAIEKLLAAEIKKSNSSGTIKGYTLTPEEKIKSQYFSKNKGTLPWPVEKGVIVGTFGVNSHESVSGLSISNNGIDIATDKNSAVRTIFEGEVSGIIDIPGAGKAVVVKHGDYRAVYSNLQNVFVEKGQVLETKQEIGILRADGNQSTAHLEIWKISDKGMLKKDPSTWIAK